MRAADNTTAQILADCRGYMATKIYPVTIRCAK